MTTRVGDRRDDAGLETARSVARIMDRYYLDPILGFVIPGAGDALSSALGLHVVAVAVRRGVPRVVVARMLINLGLDATLGAIPIAGDLFDLAFKAHARNLALLERRYHADRATGGDWLVILGAVFALGAIIAVPLLIVSAVIGWLF